MTKPMMPPRQIGPIERRHSSRVNQSLPLMRIIWAAVPWYKPSIPRNTSASAKSPTTTTTKPTPSWNSATPMTKRGWPLCRSIPMVAIIRPTIVESMPFAGEAPVSEATAVIANSISVKYSAGPNFSAIDVSGTAKSVSPTTPRVPAMKEPIAATASAAPARPFFAIS
jgi:hypothetical protein